MADVTLADLLSVDRIVLGGTAGGWEDAVRQVGDLLVSSGAVSPDYVDAMVEREESISTFVGEGVAIPHGTLAGRAAEHHPVDGQEVRERHVSHRWCRRT